MGWQNASLALMVYKKRVALNSLQGCLQADFTSLVLHSFFLYPSALPVLTVSGVCVCMCVAAYGCMCVEGF